MMLLLLLMMMMMMIKLTVGTDLMTLNRRRNLRNMEFKEDA